MRNPANHSTDSHMRVPSDWTCANRGFVWAEYRSPSVSTRTVSTQIVTGLCSTKGFSQLGNVSSGTNAVLTNTNGNTIVNSAACTASTVFNDRPAKADT